MAKRVYYSDEDSFLKQPKTPKARRRWPKFKLTGKRGSALLAGALLAAYVGGSYFVPGLPVLWQRLVGVGCAGLALLTYLLATRNPAAIDDVLTRLSEGAHGEEIQQAMHRQRRSIRLPLLGEISLRLLGAVAVVLLAGGWWFTPWAPIRVTTPVIQDLTLPFAEEIAGASFLVPTGNTPILRPPIVPSEAPEVANRIRNDEPSPYLQGLKAIAQRRFADARVLLVNAERDKSAEPAQINLTQAQNEMFAGSFAAAAVQYAKVLKVIPDEPLLLCQAAVAWMQAGQYAAAQPLVERAMTLAEKLDEGDPKRAFCLHARALWEAGPAKTLPEAELTCLSTRQVLEKSSRPKRLLFAASENNQAILYWLRANYAGAEELGRYACEHWSERLGPDDILVAAGYGNLAMLRFDLGRFDRASQTFARSDAILNRAVAGGRLPAEHPLPAIVGATRGLRQLTAGQFTQAQQTALDALAMGEKTLGPECPALVPILDTLATAYFEQGLYGKAEDLYSRAIRIAKNAWGEKHPALAPLYRRLARLYVVQRRWDNARPAVQELLDITKTAFGEDHPYVAAALNLQGEIVIGTKPADPRDARADLERALKIREDAFGKDHPDVVRTMANLAALNTSPRTYARGVGEYNKAIESMGRLLGDQHPEVADLLYTAAAFCFRHGKNEDAVKYLERALPIQEKTLSAYNPKLANTLDGYAAVLQRMDPKDARVAAMYARAKEIRQQHELIIQQLLQTSVQTAEPEKKQP